MIDASLSAACLNAAGRFTRWLERHGEVSFDHQTLYAGPVGGRAKAAYYSHPRLGKLLVAPLVLCEALLPSARRAFITQLRFPIADAHYAMGFAALHVATGEQAHHARAVHFLEVLEATRCPGFERHAWGYPFDWVTRTGVMKAQTPLITTTPYAYEAFEAVHRIDGNPRWQAALQSIAEHALRDFPDRLLPGGAATVGYNPVDPVGGVVNASAYRAFLLTSAGLRFDRPDYLEAAGRNLRFVLDMQQPDGSWPYAADGVRGFVDHFHTCFVLKALAKIEKLRGPGPYTSAIDRGLDYYVQHLFNEEGLPRPFSVAPRLTVYKQELYDYAECINLGLLLRGRHAGLDSRLEHALRDLLDRWQRPSGAFRARRLLLGWDDVPMHRWAQSQAFRSLSLAALAGSTASATPTRAAGASPARPEPAALVS